MVAVVPTNTYRRMKKHISLLRWELVVKVETTGQVVSRGSGRHPPPSSAEGSAVILFSTTTV